MTAVRRVGFELDGPRRREFRRFLLASVLLHAGLATLLATAPTMPRMRTPRAIAVSLVAAPPSPRAAPVPAPRPRPTAPAPVVLPREPTLPRPAPKPPPKPRVRPEPRPQPAPPRDYADVMAELRSELGEKAPQAPAESAPTPAAPAAAPGGGGIVSPEMAAWMRAARVHLKRTWVVPASFRIQALETLVLVDLAADGTVRGQRVERPSGNPWYDDGVTRSVAKASPFPPPPRPGEIPFLLRSDEF